MKSKRESINLNFPQLSRIAYIDNEIAKNNYPSARKLAEEYQVSTKSIQRTIEFMKNIFNAPVIFDKKIKGYKYTDKNFRLNPLTLNETDLHTLALIQQAVAQYKSPIRKEIDNLFNKLYYLYGDRLNIQLRDIENVISFKIGSSRIVNDEIFEKLKTAVKEFITVDTSYISGHSGRLSRRLLDPYHIINDKGEWYLAAFCHKDNFIKLFSINRFRQVVLTKKEFEHHKDFDIKKYFENSFGIFESKNIYNVKIYFNEDTGRYIKEKVWHKSQRIKENRDGSIILAMKVNSLEEVRYWILTWGSSCKVLSPKKLRNEMTIEVNKMLKNYSDSK